jgi:hypothetical protein
MQTIALTINNKKNSGHLQGKGLKKVHFFGILRFQKGSIPVLPVFYLASLR